MGCLLKGKLIFGQNSVLIGLIFNGKIFTFINKITPKCGPASKRNLTFNLLDPNQIRLTLCYTDYFLKYF